MFKFIKIKLKQRAREKKCFTLIKLLACRGVVRRTKRSINFTLIELLVAMAVFTLLMLALMQFFSSAQKVMKNTNQRTIMYENVRIAFDLITRDLQNAMYDGDKILFWHKGASEIYFISAVGTKGSSAKSNVAEIGYKLDTGDDWLDRSQINDSAGSWNFYTASGISAWSTTSFQKLIPYVVGLTFTCDGDSTGDTSNPTPFPSVVKVELTVLDKNNYLKWKESSNVDIKNNNEIKFSKTIFLPKRFGN